MLALVSRKRARSRRLVGYIESLVNWSRGAAGGS